jgi:hypothetical protein
VPAHSKLSSVQCQCAHNAAREGIIVVMRVMRVMRSKQVGCYKTVVVC